MRLRLVAFPNLFPGFQIQASLWKRHFDARCSIALPPAEKPDERIKPLRDNLLRPFFGVKPGGKRTEIFSRKAMGKTR